MAKRESNILREAMLEASRLGSRIFRNNIGVAVYPDGSRVAYGLCPGSSDLIGWTPITITPEMVGKKLAVFTAIETKSAKGGVQDNQDNFVDQVKVAGGYAGIARTPEDVRNILSGK